MAFAEFFENFCNLIKRETKDERETELGRRKLVGRCGGGGSFLSCMLEEIRARKFLNSRLLEWLSTCETYSTELPRKSRLFAHEQGPMAGWLVGEKFSRRPTDMHARLWNFQRHDQFSRSWVRRSHDSRDYGAPFTQTNRKVAPSKLHPGRTTARRSYEDFKMDHRRIYNRLSEEVA